jgi:hypothetical protein
VRYNDYALLDSGEGILAERHGRPVDGKRNHGIPTR